MDDYLEGAEAVEAYLAWMQVRAASIEDYLAVATIRRFLDEEEGWDHRGSRGWSATRREAFESHCAAILTAPEWDDRIRAGLMSEDRVEFWRADMAARERGIDTFEIQVAKIRLAERGSEPGSKQTAVERSSWPHWSASYLRSTRFPLARLKPGIGPKWRPHAALDWTLQSLRNHVGVGPDLVLIGLQGPVVRNRNMSLNVLKEGPPEVLALAD